MIANPENLSAEEKEPFHDERVNEGEIAANKNTDNSSLLARYEIVCKYNSHSELQFKLSNSTLKALDRDLTVRIKSGYTIANYLKSIIIRQRWMELNLWKPYDTNILQGLQLESTVKEFQRNVDLLTEIDNRESEDSKALLKNSSDLDRIADRLTEGQEKVVRSVFDICSIKSDIDVEDVKRVSLIIDVFAHRLRNHGERLVKIIEEEMPELAGD